MARIRRQCRFAFGAALALLRAFIVALGLSGVAFSARAAAPNKITGSQQAAFRGFVETLWPLAEARGVSRATFDSAFAGVTFDPKVAASAESQPEFVRPIWDYVTSAVSADRIERGRDRARSEALWLARAKDLYGVDDAVILGSGGWRRISAVLLARTISFSRSPASPTFTFRATISVTNCFRRWSSSRRATSLRRSCAARGQARWDRRSSCRRAT